MDILVRREAVQQAQKLLQQKPVYLDTETTGTGPNAEVVEIALVDYNGAVLFESLVKPKGAIEPDAQRVHGISHADLQTAPAWADVWPQVEQALGGQAIGAYNSEFDLRLLKQSHQRAWLKWTLPDSRFFCIMKLYARFNGEWDSRKGGYRWQSLEMAGRQAGISLPNSHRASDDALLARALLEYMANWKP